MSQLETNLLRDTLNQIAEASGIVIKRYFRQPLELDGKDAPSPVVTIADLETERAMRDVIATRHPDHQIIGEEHGVSGSSDTCWVLDPIDGTIAFACGKPIFCTLVGVYENDNAVAAMIDQPITGERWLNVDGSTQLNNEPCKVSGIARLQDARLGTTDIGLMPENVSAWFKAVQAEARITSFGGDGYAYGLLASGHLDLIIESGLAWHDAAALVPIIEGSGGTICDFTGNAIKPGQESYDVIAAASAPLCQAALCVEPRP